MGMDQKTLYSSFSPPQRKMRCSSSMKQNRYSQSVLPSQIKHQRVRSTPMRTELFMAIDSFDGLVIFATNLADSYDNAAESRLPTLTSVFRTLKLANNLVEPLAR